MGYFTLKSIFVSLILLFTSAVFSQNLRPLSPDRPHQTESSVTTDKGHFMLEADFLNYRKETTDGLTSNATGVFYFNAKYGFHKNMDIEVLSGTFTQLHFPSSLLSDKKTFFDDFLFRYKLNLIGNDSGSISVALMPFVSTSNMFREKFVVNDFGFLLNLDKQLSERCGIGYTGGLSSFSLDGKNNYELFSTASFDYQVTGNLHHFVEGSYRYNESAAYLHTYSFDSGLTFTPRQNLQFDCGFYYFFPVNTLFAFVGGSIRL